MMSFVPTFCQATDDNKVWLETTEKNQRTPSTFWKMDMIKVGMSYGSHFSLGKLIENYATFTI